MANMQDEFQNKSQDHLSQTQAMPTSEEPDKGVSPAIIFIILALVIGGGATYLLMQDNEPETPTPIQLPEPEPEPIPEPEPEPEVVEPEPIPEPEPFIQKEPVEATPIEKPEPVVNPLPNLDESDSWFAEQLNNISWRKELVRLVVKDDTIRRFVVFTDNFANGIVAYEHSPLKLPKEKFEALELDAGDTLVWDESSSKRFEPYIQLLRSVESDKLVTWYLEAKPLIDEAYAELGYPDTDFTETLLVAIERVLESNIMQSTPELVRPSVMYKFADERLENMSEADKLLMRLGKDNLVMLKASLLEVDEKLKAKQ